MPTAPNVPNSLSSPGALATLAPDFTPARWRGRRVRVQRRSSVRADVVFCVDVDDSSDGVYARTSDLRVAWEGEGE